MSCIISYIGKIFIYIVILFRTIGVDFDYIIFASIIS